MAKFSLNKNKKISDELLNKIASFIDENYIDISIFTQHDLHAEAKRSVSIDIDSSINKSTVPNVCGSAAKAPTILEESTMSLDELVNQVDESFSEMLLRKIDEKGMTDAQCYKKAAIDRKLFSKIRSDRHYRPSKATAISFAIALELTLEETKDMLMKAGFALSRSSKFDIIIEYFLQNHNYNIFEINEALYAFDQPLLR